MAYPTFDATKPTWVGQTGVELAQNVRDNVQAIRDACVLGGGFPGWNCTPSGGTAPEYAVLTYANGVERVKVELTWGTTGGEDGNPTVAAYSYSADSGSTYSAIGTKTITYDADGYVTATNWS